MPNSIIDLLCFTLETMKDDLSVEEVDHLLVLAQDIIDNKEKFVDKSVMYIKSSRLS